MLLIVDGPEGTNIEHQIRELGLVRCATITGFLRGQDLESALDSEAEGYSKLPKEEQFRSMEFYCDTTKCQ